MSFDVVGKGVPRHRVEELVTGESKYVSDISLAGMLHGVIVRSPHPHAIIKSIDVEQAKKIGEGQEA